MVLIDTSIWVDHFRKKSVALSVALEGGQVCTHEFVVGELSCGNLAHRAEILGALSALPHLPVVDHREALGFLEARKLSGLGLGWIDVHLLASSLLARSSLWTADKRLAAAARQLDMDYVQS